MEKCKQNLEGGQETIGKWKFLNNDFIKIQKYALPRVNVTEDNIAKRD